MQAFSLEGVIEIENKDIKEGLSEFHKSVYGKFISEKDLNDRGLRNAMAAAWGCQSLRMIKCGLNLYQFFLKEEKEVRKALFQGPWCFDDQLMIFERWFRGLRSKTSSLTKLCSGLKQPEFLKSAALRSVN